MRTLFILLITIFFSSTIFCQAEKNERVKIVLIGMMHFEPSSVDMFKNKALDILAEKKQKEIKTVVEKIANLNPDQICIEYPSSSQTKMDSIFQAYLKGNYQLDKSEVDQLGLRSAKHSNLERLTCINYYGNFDKDTVMNFALNNNQANVVEELGNWGNTFMTEINEKLEKETINDFLIYLNSKNTLNQNASFYSKYLSKIGKEENYIGTNLVADWYSTNLHIYANILREVKPTDEMIVVMFGQGHIPILKHLFETNSDFEIIEVAEILK